MEYLRTSKFLFSVSRNRKIVSSVQLKYCSNLARTTANSRETQTTAERFRSRISSGPTFQDFTKGVSFNKTSDGNVEDHGQHTYFSDALDMGNFRKGEVFFSVCLTTCFLRGWNHNRRADFMLQFILRPMAAKWTWTTQRSPGPYCRRKDINAPLT